MMVIELHPSMMDFQPIVRKDMWRLWTGRTTSTSFKKLL